MLHENKVGKKYKSKRKYNCFDKNGLIRHSLLVSFWKTSIFYVFNLHSA